MKQLLCMVLTLALLLGMTPALAAEGDRTLLAADPGSDDYYKRSVVDIDADGDVLYIVADGQLMTYQIGDEAPKVLLSNLVTSRNMWELEKEAQKHAVGAIFAEDGVITALNMYTGYLFTVSVGADGTAQYGERIQLETESRSEEEDSEYLEFQFEDALLVDGTLYVNGYDYASGGEQQMFAWDAATGKQKELDDTWAQTFCEYKDGKLLIVTGDRDNMYDREAGRYKPWTLAVYDPETGDVEEITQVSDLAYHEVRAIAYDESTDTLYIGAANKIYRMVSLANFELAAYHPATDLYSEGKNMVTCGGQVALFDNYGLYLRTADPAQLPDATLSIYGYYGTREHVQAMQALGDIPVFFVNAYYNSAQELGQALASGENQLDILSISLDWIDFTRLMEKGYCQDLSENDVISAYVKEMYPFMQDAVMLDGKIMAVPTDMYAFCWHYNREGFEKLGLEVPETYAEMAELMNNWASDENEENRQEYALYGEEGSWKEIMVRDALTNYEQYQLSRGESIDLNNDAFRNMMTALDAIDTEDVEVHIDWENVMGDELPEELNELWMKDALLYNYYNVDPQMNYDMDLKPLHLKTAENTEYVLPAHVTVMFVNPRSENLETAVKYLEALVKAKQADKIYMTTVSPAHNEPVINENYEENLKSFEKGVEQIKVQIEKADPIDKPALEEQLASYMEYRDLYEKEERYSITAEEIAAYRAEMEHAVLERPSVMNSSYDEGSFHSLIQRYLDGQINLEQFISEGGSKLRLMQLENQ